MRADRRGMVLPKAILLIAIGVAIGIGHSWAHKPIRTKVDAPAKSPDEIIRGAGTPGAAEPQDSAVTPDDVAQPDPAPADETPTPAPVEEPAEEDGHYVTVAQAHALFKSGAAFVDARKPEEFTQGHVPNAVRLTLEDFAAGTPDILVFAIASSDTPVIVYCIGGDCDESDAVARQLNGIGYVNVFVLKAGFPGWVEAGHEIETGEGAW